MNIGLMGNSLRPIIQQGMIYGYDVAVNDIVDSLFQYSEAETIYCFYEPEQFQQAMLSRKVGKNNKRGNKKNIDMVSEYDLIFRGEKAFPNVDIIHNVSSDFFSLVALRETVKKRIPITYTIHCASYPEMLNSYFLQMVLQPLKSYDALICTSEAVRLAVDRILNRVERTFNIKRKVRLEKISLGVDTQKFSPKNKYDLRQKYGIEQDSFVILWLGRLSAVDKADLFPLLLVIKRLISKNPSRKIQLLLAGYQPKPTEYAKTLNKLVKSLGIEGNVIFYLNHDITKRDELYNISDVFTSPVDNVQETFGITPLEAMACGIPQIVSDWDGYRDTVVNGITGFRIKTYWSDASEDLNTWGFLPTDVQHRNQMHHFLLGQSVAMDINEYENALQCLLDNPQLCKEMSYNSRKEALSRYSWNVVVRQMDDLWKSLVEKSTISEESFYPQQILLPDYCRDFQSYPSVYIDDSEIFYVCERENSFMLNEFPTTYGIEKYIINHDIINLIVNNKNRTVTINDIEKNFDCYSKSQIRRTVMFLYKCGIIERKR